MRERLQAGLSIVVVLVLFAIVIDASDNYTVNKGANQNITAHTICSKVTNNTRRMRVCTCRRRALSNGNRSGPGRPQG